MKLLVKQESLIVLDVIVWDVESSNVHASDEVEEHDIESISLCSIVVSMILEKSNSIIVE